MICKLWLSLISTKSISARAVNILKADNNPVNERTDLVTLYNYIPTLIERRLQSRVL